MSGPAIVTRMAGLITSATCRTCSIGYSSTSVFLMRSSGFALKQGIGEPNLPTSEPTPQNGQSHSHVCAYTRSCRHSHTEIADRLFSLMKRIFETDSSARVQGVNTFVDMESRLREEFGNCPEELRFRYNFANWNLEKWLGEMVAGKVDSSLFCGEFARYSFDNVFKYEYKGASHWQHGGVHVVYKDRLSWTGTANDAEWAPIYRVTKPGVTPGAPPVVQNATTKEGVLFVPRPPDMRTEPEREEWNMETNQKQAAACRGILKHRRDGELSTDDKRFWFLMQTIHERTAHSSAMQNLPHTFTVHGDDATEDYLGRDESFSMCINGSPTHLKVILKKLMRFDRPLITWDIFEEEAPSAFSEGESVNRSHSATAAGQIGVDINRDQQLRDPRVVNAVTHLGYTDPQLRANLREVDIETWVEDQPARVDIAKAGELYIVRCDEEDGEFKMALILLEKSTTDEQMLGWWFARKGRKHEWSKPSRFKKWPSDENWSSDPIDMESLLMKVENEDLTEGGLANKKTAPVLDTMFVKKLKAFAVKHNLYVPPASANQDERACLESDAEELGHRRQQKRPHQPNHGPRRINASPLTAIPPMKPDAEMSDFMTCSQLYWSERLHLDDS